MNEQAIPSMEAIEARATAWHLATAGADMDWDGFTRWLEADPRHAHAYDTIAAIDALLEDRRAGLLAASPVDIVAPASTPRRMLQWGSGIAAAAAAVLLALGLPHAMQPAEQDFTTGDTARVIALADGSRITLAPRSRLTVTGADAQTMRLEGGGWFAIRHRRDRALAIRAGALLVRDIGTRFDIQVDRTAVRLAVAEGQVSVAAAGLAAPLAVKAAQALRFDAGQSRITLTAAPPTDMGSWRQDRLSYENAPLALVASDLRRYAGLSLKVPGSLGDRRFSGTLVIGDAGRNGRAAQDLARLMGVTLASDGGGLRLLPDRREPRAD